jgi:predicted transcriptional regulator
VLRKAGYFVCKKIKETAKYSTSMITRLIQENLGAAMDFGDKDQGSDGFIGLTASIVSAYVSNNSVSAGDLPSLISHVHSALVNVSEGRSTSALEPAKPAISVKKSVTDEYLICLEDGKRFKSLKRHLRTRYDLSPDQYREKWGLPTDYPMVAPNYAQARSRLAKEMGLGQQRRRRAK